jgi:hypothetical protein
VPPANSLTGGSVPAGRQAGSIPPEEKRCVNPSTTSPDGRCRNYRLLGGTQCAHHGNAPQVQSAVARRAAEHMATVRAMKRLEREGYPVISGPEAVIEILEERLSVQVGLARALDTIVRRLTEAEEIRYENRAGEQLRGEVQAWLKLNEQVTRLGSDYLKIGLDERKVRIAEAQAQILIGVIQAVMGRLELTSAQRKLAAVVIPEELERVAIEGQQ